MARRRSSSSGGADETIVVQVTGDITQLKSGLKESERLIADFAQRVKTLEGQLQRATSRRAGASPVALEDVSGLVVPETGTTILDTLNERARVTAAEQRRINKERQKESQKISEQVKSTILAGMQGKAFAEGGATPFDVAEISKQLKTSGYAVTKTEEGLIKGAQSIFDVAAQLDTEANKARQAGEKIKSGTPLQQRRVKAAFTTLEQYFTGMATALRTSFSQSFQRAMQGEAGAFASTLNMADRLATTLESKGGKPSRMQTIVNKFLRGGSPTELLDALGKVTAEGLPISVKTTPRALEDVRRRLEAQTTVPITQIAKGISEKPMTPGAHVGGRRTLPPGVQGRDWEYYGGEIEVHKPKPIAHPAEGEVLGTDFARPLTKKQAMAAGFAAYARSHGYTNIEKAWKAFNRETGQFPPRRSEVVQEHITRKPPTEEAAREVFEERETKQAEAARLKREAVAKLHSQIRKEEIDRLAREEREGQQYYLKSRQEAVKAGFLKYAKKEKFTGSEEQQWKQYITRSMELGFPVSEANLTELLGKEGYKKYGSRTEGITDMAARRVVSAAESTKELKRVWAALKPGGKGGITDQELLRIMEEGRSSGALRKLTVEPRLVELEQQAKARIDGVLKTEQKVLDQKTPEIEAKAVDLDKQLRDRMERAKTRARKAGKEEVAPTTVKTAAQIAQEFEASKAAPPVTPVQKEAKPARARGKKEEVTTPPPPATPAVATTAEIEAIKGEGKAEVLATTATEKTTEAVKKGTAAKKEKNKAKKERVAVTKEEAKVEEEDLSSKQKVTAPISDQERLLTQQSQIVSRAALATTRLNEATAGFTAAEESLRNARKGGKGGKGGGGGKEEIPEEFRVTDQYGNVLDRRELVEKWGKPEAAQRGEREATKETEKGKREWDTLQEQIKTEEKNAKLRETLRKQYKAAWTDEQIQEDLLKNRERYIAQDRARRRTQPYTPLDERTRAWIQGRYAWGATAPSMDLVAGRFELFQPPTMVPRGGLGPGITKRTDVGMTPDMRALMTSYYGQGETVTARQLGRVGIEPKLAQEAQGRLKGIKESFQDIGKAAKAAADGSDSGGKRMKDAFGQVDISVKGLLSRIERLAYFQASWYATKALIFMPAQMIQQVIGYQALIDKTGAMLARYGALEGQSQKQARDTANEITTQARQIATVVPASFEQIMQSADRLRAAGVSIDTVKGSLEAFAKIQFTYPEIEMERFTNAIVGFVNTFKKTGELGKAEDDAERFKIVLDKVTKALAVGVIQPRDITSVIQHLGQMSQAAGFSIDQMLALSVMITNMGAKANLGARALRGLIDSLQTPQGISALSRIGVHIDRNATLASQFLEIIKKLRTALGTGQTGGFEYFATLFMKDIAPVERRSALVALIKELENYQLIEEGILASKSSTETAAEAASRNMTAAWQLAKTALLEVGVALAPTKETLNALAIIARDMARGLLFALNPALVETKVNFGELGSAGKATYDTMVGLKGVFSSLWTVLGAGSGPVKLFLAGLDSIKGILPYIVDALAIFYGGKLVTKLGGKVLGIGQGAKLAEKERLFLMAEAQGYKGAEAAKYFPGYAGSLSKVEEAKLAGYRAYQASPGKAAWSGISVTQLPAASKGLGAPAAISGASALAREAAATELALAKTTAEAARATSVTSKLGAVATAASAGFLVLSRAVWAFTASLLLNPFTWLAVGLGIVIYKWQEAKEISEKAARGIEESIQKVKDASKSMTPDAWDLKAKELQAEKDKLLKELKDVREELAKPLYKGMHPENAPPEKISLARRRDLLKRYKEITGQEYMESVPETGTIAGWVSKNIFGRTPPGEGGESIYDIGMPYPKEVKPGAGALEIAGRRIEAHGIKPKAKLEKEEEEPLGVDKKLERVTGIINQLMSAYSKMIGTIKEQTSSALAMLKDRIEMDLIDPMVAYQQELDIITKQYEEQKRLLAEQKKLIGGQGIDLEKVAKIIEGILTSEKGIALRAGLPVYPKEEAEQIRQVIRQKETGGYSDEKAYDIKHYNEAGKEQAWGAYGFTPGRWVELVDAYKARHAEDKRAFQYYAATKQEQDDLVADFIKSSLESGKNNTWIYRSWRGAKTPEAPEYARDAEWRQQRLLVGKVRNKEVVTEGMTEEQAYEELAKGYTEPKLGDLLKELPKGGYLRRVLEQAIQRGYGQEGTGDVEKAVAEVLNQVEKLTKEEKDLIANELRDVMANRVKTYNLIRDRELREFRFRRDLAVEETNQSVATVKDGLDTKAKLEAFAHDRALTSTTEYARQNEETIRAETAAEIESIKQRWAEQLVFFGIQRAQAGVNQDKIDEINREEALERARLFGPNGEVVRVQQQGNQKLLDQQIRLLNDVRYIYENFGLGPLMKKVTTDMAKEWGNTADRIVEATQGMFESMRSSFSEFFDDFMQGKLKHGSDYIQSFANSFRKVWADTLSKQVMGWMMGSSGQGTVVGEGEKQPWLDTLLGRGMLPNIVGGGVDLVKKGWNWLKTGNKYGLTDAVETMWNGEVPQYDLEAEGAADAEGVTAGVSDSLDTMRQRVEDVNDALMQLIYTLTGEGGAGGSAGASILGKGYSIAKYGFGGGGTGVWGLLPMLASMAGMAMKTTPIDNTLQGWAAGDLPETAFHKGGLVLHHGGEVGGIPRFHNGAPLAPDERATILQTRERVLSRDQNQMFEEMYSKIGGLSTGGTTIHVPISIDRDDKKLASELRSEIEGTVKTVLRRHM